MASQLTDEEKMKRSDFIILNNEEQLLIPQVLKIDNELSGIKI
jgi:dephospho-CoA kinase